MQTQRLNLKVLELVKEMDWPLYNNLKGISTEEMVHYFHLFAFLVETFISCSRHLLKALCGILDFVAIM